MKKLDLKNIHEWPLSMKFLMIALCCASVFYFGYNWDLSKIKKQMLVNKQQENDYKTQLDATLQQYSDLKTAISQLTDIEKLLDDWQKKLISTKDLPELLNQILKLGTASGLQFNLFNPGTEVKVNGYVKVPIKIVATGDYNQISTFISKVANLPSLVTIGDFYISRMPQSPDATLADQATSVNQLTAQIILEVYHLDSK